MKRNKHLVSISREHHFILLFCWKVRTGVKTNISYKRIRDYVDYFWRHILQPHLEEEEQCLSACREDILVQKALADHQQMKEYAAQLLLQDNGDNKDMLHLADMVDSHTRFEERELFPHLEETLPDAVLENIGRLLATQHAIFKDEYADEFWAPEEKTLTNG